MRARLANDESGFALPLAISVIAMIALLLVAVIAFATHSTDRANRDRAATRALAAADAGIDAALYRMNKALFASQVEGVLGVPAAALAETQCLSVDLGLGRLELTAALGNGWCPGTAEAEEIDGPAAAGGSWHPASFTYAVSTGVNIGVASDAPQGDLIERRIVARGEASGVAKRVLATAHARIASNGNLLKVFEQVGYRQCASAQPDPADPASGCGPGG